ncbi:MAG: hypothetical protein K1X55_02885 [Chitinophagales bacterium]|nr:hypothetical protein [Chitinophagales bacterium]
MRKLLFILCLLPFLHGCKQEDPIVLPFNDRLKNMTIYTMNLENSDTLQRTIEQFFYNQYGQITLLTLEGYDYIFHDIDTRSIHFEYPSNNKIKAWYSNDPQGVFLNEFYFYHRSGNLDTIETRLSIGGGSPFRSFAYNSQGELTRGLVFGAGYFSSNDSMVYENGNLVKVITDGVNAPQPYHGPPHEEYLMEYYPSQIRPLRTNIQMVNLTIIGDYLGGWDIAADGLGTDIYNWYNFTGINWLGKNQNALIKKYTSHWQGTFDFSYEFDSKGRVTKKTTYKSGVKVRITTYEYFN